MQKPYTLETYKAAGIVFTNGSHVLGGYQPFKKKPFVSGIGGMRREGETYLDTAIRETLEELFEFEEIPDSLNKHLVSTLSSKKIILTQSYVSVICSFVDLQDLLNTLNWFDLHSNVYTDMPNNLTELLFNRKTSKEKPHEISHLCLLPIVDHNLKNPYMDTYFLEDISKLSASPNFYNR